MPSVRHRFPGSEQLRFSLGFPFGFAYICRQAVEDRIQFRTGRLTTLVDARRYPRFKLEVDICIYARDSAVIRGQTVDISESGVSAMLRVEVPPGEVVRLEFALPLGNAEVFALVRQRNAFRYGFQFVEASSGLDIIGRACRQFSVEQSIREQV